MDDAFKTGGVKHLDVVFWLLFTPYQNFWLGACSKEPQITSMSPAHFRLQRLMRYWITCKLDLNSIGKMQFGRKVGKRVAKPKVTYCYKVVPFL